MNEKIRLKYSYKKEFVKIFKEKCKKEKIKYSDFIRLCMCDFLEKDKKTSEYKIKF